MTKKKSRKKRKSRILSEGDVESLTVRRFMGDVSCSLSRKMLRYLKVKPGDRLSIIAKSEGLEVVRKLNIRDEVDQYLAV